MKIFWWRVLSVHPLCGRISISLHVHALALPFTSDWLLLYYTILLLLLLLLLQPRFFLLLSPIMQRSAAKWESAEEHTFIHSHSTLLSVFGIHSFTVRTKLLHIIHITKAAMESSRFSVKMAQILPHQHALANARISVNSKREQNNRNYDHWNASKLL